MSGGRIRSIKPEILEDERTAHLSDTAWRLFVSCFVLADDYGRFRASPRHVEGLVFWGRRPGTGVSFEDAWAELISTHLVLEYIVRGERFAELTGWTKNQRVDRPGKPRIPGPNSEIRETLARPSRDPRETLATDLDHGSWIMDQDHRDPRFENEVVHPTVSDNQGHASDNHDAGDEPAPNDADTDSRPADGPQSPDSTRGGTQQRPTAPSPVLGHPGANPTQALFDTESNRPLNALETSRAAKAAKGSSAAADERAVYEHWIGRWRSVVQGKRVPDFSPERRRKVQARLAEGYTVDDLKTAIDGMFASPFHRGEGGGKRFLDLELACRNSVKTDGFIQDAPSPPPPRPTARPDEPVSTAPAATDEELAAFFADNVAEPFAPGSDMYDEDEEAS